MSYFNNKSNRWVILFLLVLNIATLSFLWINRPHPPGGPGTPPPPVGLLARELGFDKEQADALKPLMDDYFMKTDSIREQLKDNRQSLLSVIKKEPLDSQQINRILSKNEALHTLENWLFVEHYKGIALLCTPEQRQQLDKIFSRAMAPPPAGGKRGGRK